MTLLLDPGRLLRRLAIVWIGVFFTLIAACGGSTSDLDANASTGPSPSGGAGGAFGGSSGSSGSGLAGQAGKAGGAVGGAGGQGGGAGKGGSSGKGGAAGKGGSGGEAGQGGKAGQGGEAGAAGSGGTAQIVSIGVSPALSTLAVGTEAQLAAVALLSDGTTQDVTQKASWSSSSPSVAQVAAGLVKAASPGDAQITAQLGSLSGKAQIKVTSAKPLGMAITPLNVSLGAGATQQLSATLFLDDGSKQDVTLSASWSSTAPQIASVDAAGLVKALSAGIADVQAQIGQVKAVAHVAVAAAKLVSIAVSPHDPTVGVGASIAFVATGSYDDGSVSDVTKSVAWATSDQAVVAIDAAGSAAALSAGTSVVSATLDGATGLSTVTVTDAKLTSIVVSPASATVAAGGTAQLSAKGTYSDGTEIDVTASCAWSSSSPSASVSNAAGSQGEVTGVSAGSAEITCSQGGASGSAQITVTQAKLVSIVVSPSAATIGKGTEAQLKAQGMYDDGSSADVTADAAWSTSDATIASVGNGASGGLVSGVSPGVAQITAQLGGVSASAQITVTMAPLTAVTVAPAQLAMPVGKKDFLTATAIYADGTQVDVTEQAVWVSSDEAVAVVSNAPGARGLVSAEGAGSATVSASFGGLSGSASVAVSQPQVSKLEISPVAPHITVGQNQQLQAIAIFDNGTQKNVTQQATWTSSDPQVASLGATPQTKSRATGLSPGVTTITAGWSGLSGSTTLTVTDAVITSIEISPVAPTLAVGTKAQLQAVAILSDGSSQNVTNQATWQSLSPAVADVGTFGQQKGRVTALSAGTAEIQASYKGLSGSTVVTVTSAQVVSLSINPAYTKGAVGTKVLFTAQAIYSDGSSLDVSQQATWTSDSPAVADVNAGGMAKGLATALSAGTAHIQASYMGVGGAGTFEVTAAQIASISVGPVNPETGVGVKLKLWATAILTDGSSMDVTAQATWTSGSPDVADVSDALGSKGVVTPLSPGQAVITAQVLGASGSTTVTVKGAKLTQIQVTPFDPTLPVGYATQLEAVGIYDDLSTQVLTLAVAWTVSDGNVAAVSNAPGSKGRLSPLAAGTTAVQASYQGVTGSTKVTVTSASLQSITVSPDPVSLSVGKTQAFTASGDFGGGLVLDITDYVTWLSSDASVCSISNAPGSHGQAKALAPGMATLTAARDGKTGTAQVAVQ